jgi:hypothetical protein
MRNAKRARLSPRDVDSALRARRIEPLYGFTSTDYLPWRFASGGGRELHFNEDREIDLQKFLENTTSKLPPPVKVRAHWLVIDGVQPNIPENPGRAKRVLIILLVDSQPLPESRHTIFPQRNCRKTSARKTRAKIKRTRRNPATRGKLKRWSKSHLCATSSR